MDIAQIALDPPMLCQMGTVEHFCQALFILSLTLPKWAHKPSWQALWPPLKQEIAHLDVGKKCSKPTGQAFTPIPLTGNAQPIGNNKFQVGPSLR